VDVAAFELGRLYEHGVRASSANETSWLLANQELAWNWYRRGADLGEPSALARYGQSEEEAARRASDLTERHRRRLEAFKYYAAASELARREAWPDEAWREWRLHRASLARLLALEGGMPEVAATYFAALRRY
jgi:TPR repeat protein